MRSGREATCRRASRCFDPQIAFRAFMPDAREEVVADDPEEIATFMREFLSQWVDWAADRRRFPGRW